MFGMPSLLLLVGLAPAASPFDWPEIRVTPSPASPARLALSSGERVLDLAAAPDGPRVAVVIENAAGMGRVAVWSIGAAALDPSGGPRARSCAGSPGIPKGNNSSLQACKAASG